MADFHLQSLHDPIQPLVFTCDHRQSNYVHVALKPQISGDHGWKDAIVNIGKKYEQLYPKEDLAYDMCPNLIHVTNRKGDHH